MNVLLPRWKQQFHIARECQYNRNSFFFPRNNLKKMKKATNYKNKQIVSLPVPQNILLQAKLPLNAKILYTSNPISGCSFCQHLDLNAISPLSQSQIELR